MFVMLVSAGAWHWSGVDSERTLTFSTAIDVLANPDDYLFVSREAALGKVQRDMNDVLAKLKDAGDLGDFVRQGALASLDGPLGDVASYSGPFDSIRKKAGVVPLTMAERRQLVAAIAAAVGAVRALEDFDPAHGVAVAIFTRRLRKELMPG